MSYKSYRIWLEPTEDDLGSTSAEYLTLSVSPNLLPYVWPDLQFFVLFNDSSDVLQDVLFDL